MNALYSDMTRDELLALYEQHGTWRRVAKALGIPVPTLDRIKRRLGCIKQTPKKNFRVKRPSLLDDYSDRIVALLGQGLTCDEIAAELSVPVKGEAVRRWIHKNGHKVNYSNGPRSGAGNPAWRGGRTVDKSGYVLVQMPDHPYANSHGYVREHRLVMELHIGRYLTPNEVVHHKNNDRSDNRIENLELFDSNADHLRETLQGQIPNWTEEGRHRIQEGVRKAALQRKTSSLN